MKRLYILTLCTVIVSAGIFLLKRNNNKTTISGEGLVIPVNWLAINKKPLTPAGDIRPADQTFLTYPEWFLVFSPEEQANYFRTYTASSFPFMRHTAQIWESYKVVNDQIKGNFPPNTGYHFMIWVIGTSASVEYAIKAWYETVIGRITDTKLAISEEDKFNQKFTQDYVDFIKDGPWYEFDFKSRLKNLWSEVPFESDHFFRTLDRRYLLTSELLVKYGYGKLIGLGTKQIYEVALPTTAVILENDSLHQLPRYDKFANAMMGLAKEGHSFKEVAGNNSAILLTVLAPSDKKIDFLDARKVFTQPIPSSPGMKRVAIASTVPNLDKLLLMLDQEKVTIEHLFDY